MDVPIKLFTAFLTPHRLLFVLVMADCWAMPSGAVSAGELDKIRETASIVIAHRNTSLPFSYLDADKRPVGYSIDLCLKVVEAIKKELKLPNLTVHYLPVTSASRIPTIVERRASIECGSTTNNAERRQLVDYSISHFISSSRFIAKTDSGINSVADQTGRKVVSTKGTSNLIVLQRLNDEQLLKLKIVEANDHAEAFVMVVSGTVDAFAMDDVLM